jgi:hypothetical protein
VDSFAQVRDSESFLSDIKNPRLKTMLAGTGYASLGWADVRLIGWLIMGTGMEGHMATDDPEVQRLEKEISQRREKLEGAMHQGTLDLMMAIGVLAGTLTPADDGFDASIGLYYGKENVARVVEGAAELVTKRRTTWREEGKAIDALRGQLGELINKTDEAAPNPPSPVEAD